MKVTVVGSGDAWGSGGRSHTCFKVDLAGRCVVADFGASALVSWHRLGLDPLEVDAFVISHLHGDHFGGLPFFLLESQFERKRTRPLEIVGPPGTQARLNALLDVFFPKLIGREWRFPWTVRELPPGTPADLLGLCVETTQVIHSPGAIDTALRFTDGHQSFAYSGDTQWTEALVRVASGTDLFITECFAWEPGVPGHIAWPELREAVPRLDASRIAVTHMGRTVLDRTGELETEGLAVCSDGLVFDI
jgi:ribonuclease BN (tRNA processing enzyme)